VCFLIGGTPTGIHHPTSSLFPRRAADGVEVRLGDGLLRGRPFAGEFRGQFRPGPFHDADEPEEEFRTLAVDVDFGHKFSAFAILRVLQPVALQAELPPPQLRLRFVRGVGRVGRVAMPCVNPSREGQDRIPLVAPSSRRTLPVPAANCPDVDTEEGGQLFLRARVNLIERDGAFSPLFSLRNSPFTLFTHTR